MTALLYIFAAIGAVITVVGIIGLAFDISQSRDDMQYYLHTRFPELEKEIAEKLAAFEAMLNERKNPVNETYILKDDYDCDWSEFSDRLDAIADDCIDRWCALLKNLEETNARLDDVIKKTGDYNIRFTRNAASLKDIHERLDTAFHEISELSDRTVILKNRLDEDDAVINSLRDKVHRLDQRMMNDMLGYLPKTITGNSPYDITLTKITVGDDPEQMQNGTTVTSLEE